MQPSLARVMGVPATTRSWNPMLSVLRILKSQRSGRRHFVGAKTTVEACLSIDIVGLSREGLTRHRTVTSGTWQWRRSGTEEVTSSIGYSIDMNGRHVRLQYTLQTEHLDYYVDLVSTCPA